MKTTAQAPSNIAFIKYWGARDLDRALPCNASISMTLERCFSRCTVEPRPDLEHDEVLFRSAGGELAPPGEHFTLRVRRHLTRLRRATGREEHFRIATENSFPSAAGLASSASGFAALALATTRALGIEPSNGELSRLARLGGSGSAARSVMGGYVEWPAGPEEEECYAVPLLAAGQWDLCDVIALVDDGPKATSSLEGHRLALTSPYFETRQRCVTDRLDAVRAAIVDRDWERLGPVIEEEAIDLHLIAMSSRPPIFYWKPGTLQVLEVVRRLRADGVSAWATMDAGANVHVICRPEAEDDVAACLKLQREVRSIIRDGTGRGPTFVEEHLL